MSSDAQIDLEMWEGPLSKRERLSEATPRALREALSRLDGNRTDCVWIEIEDVGALSIGGGPSGFVVVSFPSDGSSSHVVTGRGRRHYGRVEGWWSDGRLSECHGFACYVGF